MSIIHPALVTSQRGFQKTQSEGLENSTCFGTISIGNQLINEQCAHPFCAMKHDPLAIGNCKSLDIYHFLLNHLEQRVISYHPGIGTFAPT